MIVIIFRFMWCDVIRNRTKTVIRSQHSRERNDPRQHCFCDSWLDLWPFDAKWICFHHLSCTLADPSGFRDIVRENRQTKAGESSTPLLPTACVTIYNILRVFIFTQHVRDVKTVKFFVCPGADRLPIALEIFSLVFITIQAVCTSAKVW